MELKTVINWVVLITFLTIIFAKCGNGSTFSMLFYKTWTGGRNLESYKTLSHARSTIDCANRCRRDREMNHLCEAFWYHDLGKTCDLYSKGTTTVPNQGVEIFAFQDTDVFHDIRINGTLYSVYLSSATKSFEQARDHCNNLGGYLLEFDSPDEYEAVKMVVGEVHDSIFVGANDMEVENVWVTDREKNALGPYWHWGHGQPSRTTQENCASLFWDQVVLNDTICGLLLQFLCEKDIV